jgi:hypothetical protein
VIFRLGTQNLKAATDGTLYWFFSLRKTEIENGSEDGAVRAERYEGNGARVPHSKIAQFAILEWGSCATSADEGRHVLSFLVGCPTLPAFFAGGWGF